MVLRNLKDMVSSLMKAKNLQMKLSKLCTTQWLMVERSLLIMQQNQPTVVVVVAVACVVVAEVEVVVVSKMVVDEVAAVVVADTEAAIVVGTVVVVAVATNKVDMVEIKVVDMDLHRVLEDMVNRVVVTINNLVGMVVTKATVTIKVGDMEANKVEDTEANRVAAMEANRVAAMVDSNPPTETNKVEDTIHNNPPNHQEDNMAVVAEVTTILLLKHLAITSSNLQAKAMVANQAGDKDNHNNMVAKVMAANNNQPLLHHLMVPRVMDNKLLHPLDTVVKATVRVVAAITNNLTLVTARVVTQVAIHNSNNSLMEAQQVLAVMGETADQVVMDNRLNR